MKDPILANVVTVLDHSVNRDAGISIVINVGGHIFQGTTITERKYIDRMNERFAVAFGDKNPLFPEPSEEGETTYLHLKDVVLQSTMPHTIHMELWRVPLDDIVGFDFASPGDPVEEN